MAKNRKIIAIISAILCVTATKIADGLYSSGRYIDMSDLVANTSTMRAITIT